jgi:DNA repair protein RadC
MASKSFRKKIKMKSGRVVFERFLPFLKNLKKEIVKIVLLGPKLKFIKETTISEGSLNASIVHSRKVMVPAIKDSVTSLTLIHNHPSGDPTPNQQDFEITHRLIKT